MQHSDTGTKYITLKKSFRDMPPEVETLNFSLKKSQGKIHNTSMLYLGNCFLDSYII